VAGGINQLRFRTSAVLSLPVTASEPWEPCSEMQPAQPQTLNPKPSSRSVSKEMDKKKGEVRETLNPQPKTENPKPYNLKPEHQTLNTKPYTPPYTLNPKP